MRIIPVIDLKAGHVVRGIGGQREKYRPIRSCLVDSSLPIDVAVAIREAFGFEEFYLADLDAIEGAAPALDIYSELIAEGTRLLIDAGPANRRCAEQLAEFADQHTHAMQIVIGLESVSQPELLPELAAIVGAERAVFSLDLYEGRPRTESGVWANVDLLEVVQQAIDAGFRRLIVLDLGDVGKRSGTSTLPLCRAIRAAHSGLELIAGGGVRDATDLDRLAQAGCNGALVASALHDGRLRRPSP